MVFYSCIWVRGSNVPLLPTINILYFPDPSPISGLGQAAEGTAVVGTSDMMTVEWQEAIKTSRLVSRLEKP